MITFDVYSESLESDDDDDDDSEESDEDEELRLFRFLLCLLLLSLLLASFLPSLSAFSLSFSFCLSLLPFLLFLRLPFDALPPPSLSLPVPPTTPTTPACARNASAAARFARRSSLFCLFSFRMYSCGRQPGPFDSVRFAMHIYSAKSNHVC